MTVGIWLLIIIRTLLDVYVFAILASAILSWGILPPTHRLVQFLYFITEPLLAPCRKLLNRVLPFQWRRFDFSPVAAILLVQIVVWIINQVIRFMLYAA